MSGDAGAVRSLYLHIPFCERRCGYCDFAAVSGRAGEGTYLDALAGEVEELGRRLPDTRLDTVFVGGGTPSFVEPSRLARLLATVRACFTVEAGAEVTMEANPSSTSRERASAWLEAGFTRVSVGVQSLDPAALRFLGRVHDPDRALAAVDEVRSAGFPSVSCDLIYAVPGLTDGAWAETISGVVGREPGHVSAYELTVEPGTPLHRAVTGGAAPAVDEEAALRQHRLAADVLEAAGYRQYEVSNFARAGRECRHNLVYWRGGFYLAAGTGAHGHVPAAAARRLGLALPDGAVAARYWHDRGVRAYTGRAAAGALPIAGWEHVDGDARERERIMLGLRLSEGVELGRRGQRAALAAAAAGLLVVDGAVARTTARGRELLTALTERLVELPEPVVPFSTQ